MSDQQESNTSPPVEKFQYQQGQINTAELYLSTKFADVYFSFDSDEGAAMTRVPAHKNLLAMASDVFERMFYGALKETGDIRVIDASDAAFTEFLQFFYRSCIELTEANIGAVMYLGHKYNVEKCIDGCVEILKNNLTNENVCTALLLAILFEPIEQNVLKRACEKRILLNTAAVFQTTGFLESDSGVLAYILKMNLLSCSEVDVFEACITWVQSKSKQNTLSKAMVQQYLGDLYYEIRFASMTMPEFCALDAKYSAVLRDDFHTITCLIVKTEEESARFNASPRQVKWNDENGAIIKCNRDNWETDVKWIRVNAEEKTTFSTTEPLLLGEFTFNAILCEKYDLKSNLLVKVEITEEHSLDGVNAKVVSNFTIDLISDLEVLSLPQPILIRPAFFIRFVSNHSRKNIISAQGM